MFHTWFFLKRLANELNEELAGLSLLACFSQQKDELILSFGNQTREFHIKADLGSNAGLLSFQTSFARARRNSVDLFDEVLDQMVVKVECYNQERSFEMAFENGYSLIFKMHGRRSNVLLSKEDKVVKLFRNNLPADLEIIPSELAQNKELNVPNIIWLLGKSNSYLIDNQNNDSVELLNNLTTNSIHVGLREAKPLLSLLPINEPVLVTKKAVEASNKYAELHYRYFLFGQEKDDLKGQIKKRIKQGNSYIKKTSEKLNSLKDQRSPEEIANIIMANLHQIPSNKKSIELDDFYENKRIEIKLNPSLTPQKNAENYYRKNKNKRIEFEKLQSNINTKKEEIAALEVQLVEVGEIEDIRSLRSFKERFSKNLGKNNRAPLPYFQFDIDGWTTLVGKNAKSNDELTMRVASKNDLWLHAKDVAGSHVVLREKPGSNFPNNIIEKAAALAAWYSKRKTDSLCPVIYTPRKFVRKVKGAPPGQVVVDKEQVVMVEPTNQI